MVVLHKKKTAFNALETMIFSIQRRVFVRMILGTAVLLLIVENESRQTFSIFANALSTTTSISRLQKKSPTWERRRNNQDNNNSGQEISVGPAVVVGKIIIDEYRSPLEEEDGENNIIQKDMIEEEEEEKMKITIGGGGPQAAWGAAAALAVMEQMEKSSSSLPLPLSSNNTTNNETTSISDRNHSPSVPPKQSVAFLGPVGNANGLVPDIQQGLEEILGPAVETIQLVVEASLETPTIQLWHDEHQDIQWKPLNDCWGPKGADSLWRNRPSAEDILHQLECLQKKHLDDDDDSKGDVLAEDNNAYHPNNISNLHMIMEMGVSAAGGGHDCEFLHNAELMSRTSHVCIEPVAFPQEITMEDGLMNEIIGSMVAIPQEDVLSSQERLRPHHAKIDMVVPDSHLVDAWIKCGYLQERCEGSEVVGRFGPSGSRVYYQSGIGASSSSPESEDDEPSSAPSEETKNPVVVDDYYYIQVPTATLETPNGKPVNPTGAGNAYSAALSTCRSRGWSLEEAACLATAVGATFCEYEHLPPWTWDVLDRIQRGTLEVYNKTQSLFMIQNNNDKE